MAGARLAGASPSKARDRRGVTGLQGPRHQPGVTSVRFISLLGGPGWQWDLFRKVLVGPTTSDRVEHPLPSARSSFITPAGDILVGALLTFERF